MSNLTFGGPLREAGDEALSDDAALDVQREAFAYYETSPGGAGGGPGGPGAHVVQTHMTNTRNTPIEELELSYPVRIVALERRRSSGGRGRHAGGDGLSKELLFLEPAHVSFVAQRQKKGPSGMAGGQPGKPGGLFLQAAAEQATRGKIAGGTLKNARWRRLPGTWSGRLAAGSRLRVDTPGGGGFGS